MQMNKFFATAAASALSLSALAAMNFSASAAVTEIPYTQSESSLSTDADGRSLIRNIYNTWTTIHTTDIDGPKTTIEDNVTVEFTVSGIGDASTTDDGTQLKAWLAGSIAGNSVWKLDEAGEYAIDINGDGTYTATWSLESSENVDCLIVQTNINIYSFGNNVTGIDDTTANITVNKIYTGKEDDPAETTTTASPAGNTTTTTKTTTAKPAGGTTTTAKPAADGATTTTVKKEASAATGDMGVGLAVAAVAVAGAAAFVSRKKD